MSILHRYHTSEFSKGLTHGLSWKMKFDLSLLLVKTDLEIFFSDDLDRNKGFTDYKKCPFYRVTIVVIFLKGLTHGLSWKIEIWSLLVFWEKGPRNTVFWCST